MPQALYILFGAAFTVAVCWAFGQLLLGGLSLEFRRQEQPVFAFLLGAPCLSLLVFLLAITGLAYKGVFLGCGLVVLALAIWRVRDLPHGESLPPLPRLWRILFGVVFAVFTVLYFFNAMAPEMSPDGAAYHLGLVARYLREHGFPRITTNIYANLSQGVEMLFLFAFAFGRHSAAALVHFAFLIALPLAMLLYARRFSFAEAGVAGALFTFVSPVVGIDGSTAYLDVAVAAILFGLFYLLQIWNAERRPALLVPIGILAGFGYAVKYTAFLAVPYALGFVGFKLWRARKPWLRPLLVVGICAAAMMIPWMAKNALWLDNPFSPFFNSIFPNPYVYISFEKQYAQHMRHYGELKSLWEYPLELTVRGGRLCGLLGPLFLLAPLGLAALRFPAGRQLLLPAGLFALPYLANTGTRFLIPALPFLSLAMALALTSREKIGSGNQNTDTNVRATLQPQDLRAGGARIPACVPIFSRLRTAWRPLVAALVLAHAVLSWPDFLQRYCSIYAWRLEKIPVRQALRLESEDSYLARKMFFYPMARLIEEQVPPGSKVLSFNQLPEAYTTRKILVVYEAAFNNRLGDILQTPLIPEFQPTWQHSFRFPAQPLAKIRVVQTAAGGPDLWSVSELRVFEGLRELPRSPIWRLRAWPNPWDVQSAFDNSPVTRWRSWQSLFSGMFLEVDFGRPTTIDSVRLDCSGDQYLVRMKLEGQEPSGTWKTLADSPQQAELPPPPRLRRAAIEEVQARGIDYLVIQDSDFGADDFRQKAPLWGIRLVGERRGLRLYELNQ